MDEELQGRWFARITRPHLATYNARMADAAPYRNSPRWERERAAALKEFEDSTREARALYERAMADLAAMGEVSEATGFAMDQFVIGQVMQAAE